jgi:hypothetical protein
MVVRYTIPIENFVLLCRVKVNVEPVDVAAVAAVTRQRHVAAYSDVRQIDRSLIAPSVDRHCTISSKDSVILLKIRIAKYAAGQKLY